MSEIERKLATLERVVSVYEHPNADNLELVRIRGWQVVVKKGEFKQNDLVLYFEIDSFLPELPQFEFLRKSCFRASADIGQGFRIKTIRLRGQISQGLVMPLSEFKEFIDPNMELNKYDDFTELLGVKKWEIPLAPCLKGDALGLFPSHIIPRTDEERWQNLSSNDWKNHGHDEFEVTVKNDGSSVTFYHNEGHLGACSRNLELKETEKCLHWRIFRNSGLADALLSNAENIAIQGELCGPQIQGNRMKLDEPTYFVFNIWDISARRYFTSEERMEYLDRLCIKHNVNLNHVDIISKTYYGIPLECELVDIVTKIRFNDQIVEGVVFKSLNDPSFSFKYINPTYLLKEKD